MLGAAIAQDELPLRPTLLCQAWTNDCYTCTLTGCERRDVACTAKSRCLAIDARLCPIQLVVRETCAPQACPPGSACPPPSPCPVKEVACIDVGRDLGPGR
jgi:hypothetical protein